MFTGITASVAGRVRHQAAGDELLPYL